MVVVHTTAEDESGVIVTILGTVIEKPFCCDCPGTCVRNATAKMSTACESCQNDSTRDANDAALRTLEPRI